MTNWFSSDHHFGHANLILRFNHGGLPSRVHPTAGRRWTSVEEHDEYLVAAHNERVRPGDRWTCLGDLGFAPRDRLHALLSRMNGEKHLVLGNHDELPTRSYLDMGFKSVRSMVEMDDMLFTHVPVAPWSLTFGYDANVHGHTHLATPFAYRGTDSLTVKSGAIPTRPYLNVCVERTRYAPLSLEEIRGFVKEIR